MFELYNFSRIEIYAFGLVLIRISIFMALVPLLSIGSVPSMLKVLFSLLLAMVMFSLVPWRNLDEQVIESNLFWLAAKEAMIGLLMAGVVRIFFQAFEIGGQLISDSMGLGNAQILNPAAQIHTSVVEQFISVLMVLFFFTINGHHHFITALAESFKIVPLGMAIPKTAALGDLGIMVSTVVSIGVKIAAPVMVSVFFVNVGMAIVGRAVPQINVFITSIPVTIYVGLIVIAMSIPIFLTTSGVIINDTFVELIKVLKAL